jgi:hypothetical protein
MEINRVRPIENDLMVITIGALKQLRLPLSLGAAATNSGGN